MMIIHPDPKDFFIRHYWTLSFVALLLMAGAVAAPFLGLLDWWVSPVLVLVAALMVAGGWVHAMLRSNATSLTLDGMEVIYQTGMVSRHLVTVAVGQITDTTINQDLLDKILGSSSLRLNTSGSTGYEIEEDGFRFTQAKEMHDAIYALIDKKKEKPSKDFA